MAISNNNSTGLTQQQYQQIMDLAQQGAQAQGRPERPKWESLIGADGLMQQPYQLTDRYDTGALDQLRQDALRAPGDQSRFRQLQEAKLADLNAQAQGQTQAAMNQLASRGGLRSGAAERLAMSGARNALEQGQNMRLNLDLQDEQSRMQNLGALNQANLQAAQAQQGVQQYNIGTALNDIFQKRYADTDAYKEQLRAWGSERTAAATPSGGGGKK